MFARIAPLPLVALTLMAAPAEAQCYAELLAAPLHLPSDSFGKSVALSGGNAFVGAILDDDIANNAGAVYVFEYGPGGFAFA